MIGEYYTEHELLLLAGSLSTSCRNVLNCKSVLDLSSFLVQMELYLNEYDNAIMHNINVLEPFGRGNQ